MAMKKCKECGNEVSTKAKTCPQCGCSKPTTKASHRVLGCFILVIAFIYLVNYSSAPLQQTVKEQAAKLSANQAEQRQDKKEPKKDEQQPKAVRTVVPPEPAPQPQPEPEPELDVEPPEVPPRDLDVILAEIRRARSDQTERKLSLYNELLKIAPDDVDYKKRRDLYQRKFEKKQKEQRILEEEQKEVVHKEGVHKEDETFRTGYTTYHVWRSWWSDRLSDNQFLNQRPNAAFLFVDLTVRNDDKKARLVPPFKLEDDKGAEHEASSHGWAVEGSIGIIQSLNPSVSKQGFVVFDVPRDRNYRLKLSGGYWSFADAYVQLSPKDKK